MVQKKKSDEQDVLVVRDEKTGEISVVAGLSRDGTPKRAPAKAENTSDFLRFDRNSDLMDSFFRNFFRQCKEPSRFGFYRIAADQAENLLGVMKELLKDPEANKEILSAHKVDTSNYEKEAKQSEGQAKETASSDDASKTQANTEKENVSSEQTNEKENDMEQKPEQTATEQQAQTAPGVKQNLISGNDVNLQELGAKYGIDFNSMNEKDMKALLNYGFSTWSLVTVTPDEVLPPVPVTLGVRGTVQPVLTSENTLLVEKTLANGLTKEVALAESVAAPVYAGDTLGQLTVRDAAGNTVAELPILAGEDVGHVTFVQMLRRCLARGFCVGPRS